jgi:uncharacterized protein (TIGR02001 family)
MNVVLINTTSKINKEEVAEMNKVKLLIITLLFIVGMSLNTGPAFAAETSGSAAVDIMSNYVWRGQKLSNGVVIQPSVGITYSYFGANIWGNYDTGPGELTETDITINYARSINKFSIDAGYIYYGFDGFDDTQEFYLGVGYDVLLSPAATFYYDFDEGEGGYLNLAISHSFALPHKLSLDLGVSAGINFDNAILGVDGNGDTFTAFYDGNLSAALAIPVTDAISIAPIIAYSFALSNDAKDGMRSIPTDDEDTDIFYGGVNFTLSF